MSQYFWGEEEMHERYFVEHRNPDVGLGLCFDCGAKLILSAGWVPSYNDPDNSSGAQESEPECPHCTKATP